MRTLQALILFVVHSDNPDPYTREGLVSQPRQVMLPISSASHIFPHLPTSPHLHLHLSRSPHQVMLREQGVLELAVHLLRAPLVAPPPRGSLLGQLGLLAMKVARHALHDNGVNKAYATRFVPLLQVMAFVHARFDSLGCLWVPSDSFGFLLVPSGSSRFLVIPSCCRTPSASA